MRCRPLGKTGIEVSELALGTWGLSGEAYGPVSEAQAHGVLARALTLGVNTFETADTYGGDGAMEATLAARVPESAVIVTKIGTDRAASPPRKSFDPTFLRVSFEKCAERLKKKPDVVLLHNPSMPTLDAGAATSFLRELKKRELVRAWGVSAGTVAVAREALHQGAEVLELAYNVFVGADLHELSAEIADAGAGVLARSVLAHGLLAGHWSGEREFEPGDHRRARWTPRELAARVKQLDALRPLVTGNVLTLRAAAVRFVLANNLVSSAVLGPRTVTQLDQLAREAGAGPPYLTDTALAELASRLSTMGVPT